MEFMFAVFLVIAGIAFVIIQGFMIKKAWREAAGTLGLTFESSWWTPKIKARGTVDGFNVEMEYQTHETRSFSQGRSRTHRKSYSRIYVTHPDIPRMTDMPHPQNTDFSVSGGRIMYPTPNLRSSLMEGLLNFGGKQHFYSAENIVANIRNMVNWGKELANSGRSQAGPLSEAQDLYNA